MIVIDFTRLEKVRFFPIPGERNHNDVIFTFKIIAFAINQSQLDATNILSIISRLTFGHVHLLFDVVASHKPLPEHQEKHTGVQKHNTSTTAKQRQATEVEDDASQESENQLPEDPHPRIAHVSAGTRNP